MNSTKGQIKHSTATDGKPSVVGSTVNLEEFLKQNGFEIYTFRQTNKVYVKTITEYQNLYVRIYSDTNNIQDVEYENIASNKFENAGRISFETIDSLDKLKHLLEALK